MAKGPQILTANRLRDGAVAYWRGGQWADALADAEVLAGDAEANVALEAARASLADRVVVNPYLFEVRIAGGVTIPLKERERIRAAGPSVRGDLGKQADGLYTPPPVRSQITRAEHTPGEKDPFDVSL